MKVINTVFLAESVMTRSNILVMVSHPKSEAERKSQSPFSKLGRIGGQTIRGWLRHAVEKLLLQNGISVCHPLCTISITADRNKDYFRNDLLRGYHPRGECSDDTREWAILPQCPSNGLSKLYPHFYTTWERRKYHSIGCEDQTFAELLCTIGSWTVALATLEEFAAFLA